jgi:DNA-binding NarL/FixJ family response regulator
MMSKPRVLLADDHTMFLEGLRSLLEADCDIVGTAENGRDLLSLAQKLRPDVIVVDISMPLLNGIDATRQLRKIVPAVKIIILTMHLDMSFVREAFQAGASGYVVKKSSPSELVRAIREVLKGRSYVASLIAKPLVDTFQMDPTQSAAGALTARQIEVLQLLAEGHAPRGIASALNISVKTVEFHKYQIMERLGVRSTAELTRYAIKHGIVQP